MPSEQLPQRLAMPPQILGALLTKIMMLKHGLIVKRLIHSSVHINIEWQIKNMRVI